MIIQSIIRYAPKGEISVLGLNRDLVSSELFDATDLYELETAAFYRTFDSRKMQSSNLQGSIGKVVP